jgi:hypothetical protein
MISDDINKHQPTSNMQSITERLQRKLKTEGVEYSQARG